MGNLISCRRVSGQSYRPMESSAAQGQTYDWP